MPEIVLNVRSNRYEDGDILCAFPDRAIRAVHAQHVSFNRDPATRRVPLTGHGLCDDTDVLHDMMEITHQYKMERLNRLEVRWTRLSDNTEIQFTSNVPFADFDGKIVAMDVELYFARALSTLRRPNAQGRPVFGTGDEQCHYFSGHQDWSDAAVDAVWTKIHEKTPVRDTTDDMQEWPEGRRWLGRTQGYESYMSQGLKSFLFLPSLSFTDAEAAVLTSAIVDDTDPENVVTVKHRKHYVDWRSMTSQLNATAADIEHPGRGVDVRRTASGRPFNPNTIVRGKP